MDWQTQQILCIECENLRLYGEAIQMVSERKLCWLRPLALTQWNLESQTIVALHDLREGADLFCPDILCRAAFDTEVLPVLSQLEAEADCFKATAHDMSNKTSYLLQSFLRKLCKMLPDTD